MSTAGSRDQLDKGQSLPLPTPEFSALTALWRTRELGLQLACCILPRSNKCKADASVGSGFLKVTSVSCTHTKESTCYEYAPCTDQGALGKSCSQGGGVSPRVRAPAARAYPGSPEACLRGRGSTAFHVPSPFSAKDTCHCMWGP